MTLRHRSLALLLDPEKADLARLSFTDECHPDYLFVGGSIPTTSLSVVLPAVTRRIL